MKYRCLVVFLILCSILSFSGCGKEVSSAKITRDDEFVGGNLTFVYDEKLREISVGGEGEFIQFYDKDLARNWEAGNRIGLKIIAPKEIDDHAKTTIEIDGVTFVDMFVKIDGQRQDFFNIYPIVTEKTKEINFKICWNESVNAQNYKIKIMSGTKLLDQSGKVIN